MGRTVRPFVARHLVLTLGIVVKIAHVPVAVMRPLPHRSMVAKLLKLCLLLCPCHSNSRSERLPSYSDAFCLLVQRAYLSLAFVKTTALAWAAKSKPKLGHGTICPQEVALALHSCSAECAVLQMIFPSPLASV